MQKALIQELTTLTYCIVRKTYLSSEAIEVPFILSITPPPIGQKKAIICNVLINIYVCLLMFDNNVITCYIHQFHA
jgi:hypothetical protein